MSVHNCDKRYEMLVTETIKWIHKNKNKTGNGIANLME